MFSWKKLIFIAFFFLYFVFFSVSQLNQVQAVACGGDCSVYGCDGIAAPYDLTCSGVCGQVYNSCSGSTCQLNTGWNASTCNSADCTNPGTTRTAIWTYGACTTNCGNSNTRLGTCTDQAENNCTQGVCSSPAGVVGGTYTDATCACVSQAPEAPVVTGAGNGSCTTNGVVNVTWTFGSGVGCGSAWGNACLAPGYTFSIFDGAVAIVLGIPAGTSPYSQSITLSNGPHNIKVRANNGSLFTDSANYPTTINIDTTAPAIPGGRTITFIPDPACTDIFFAQYSWNAATVSGCAGLHALPYWAQGSSDVGFGSVLFGWNNTWVNSLTQTTTQGYIPGTTLNFHVQSRDELDNQSGFSVTDSVTVPTPSPYPTIHVAGTLVEDVNGTCSPMSLMSNFSLAPVIVPSAGVTPVCTMPTTSSYSCDFTINNQTGSCTSPTINVTMSGTYGGYGTIGWRTGSGGGQCNGSPTGIDLTPGDDTRAPLYFAYNAIIPTFTPPTPTPVGNVVSGNEPTPTPLIAAGWFKVKDTSFNSRQSRQNYIPYTLTRYNTNDADDTDLTRNTLSGNSGVLFQTGSLDAGANAYVNNEKSFSTKNWYTEANVYTPTNDISYTKYVNYLKSRKDFKTINALTAINAESVDGIYSVPGDVTLTAAQFDGKKIVLIVEGKATFATNFIPNNGSVAVIAQTIEIVSTVAEVDAILIGGTVTTGISSTGLKIKGNLINESALSIDRSQINGRMPSLFVVFDPLLYLNVMPFLSTSTYDWRQIQ